MASFVRQRTLELLKDFQSNADALRNNPDSATSFFNLADTLLASLDAVSVSLLTADEQRGLMIVGFRDSHLADSLVFLCGVISEKNGSAYSAYQQQLAAWMLSQIVTAAKMQQVMVDSTTDADPGTVSIGQNDLLVQCLVSVPDRIANVSKRNGPSGLKGMVSAEKYVKTLSVAVLRTLDCVHNRISSGQNASLQFLSSLLSRFVRSGHGSDILLDILVAFLLSKSKSDFIWRRISHRLLCGISAPWLDVVLWEVMARVRSPADVNFLFGDSSDITSGKLKHFFVQKVLVSCCESSRHLDSALRHRMADNVTRYLAASENLRPLLVEALKDIADIWRSKVSITKSPFPKHLALSQLLLNGVKLLPDVDKAAIKSHLMNSLLAGMEHHLASADARVRQVGMTVGEELMGVLEMGDVVLKFDDEMDPECKSIKSKLLQPMQASGSADENDLMGFEKLFAEQNLEEAEGVIAGANAESSCLSVSLTNSTTQLDSDDDDDLVPFDIPADGLTPVKPPVYIRDAMEDLFEERDYAKFTAAFGALEGMIRRRAVGLDDVALELLKIVLHLENKFAEPSFESQRMLIMTALVQHIPTGGALYLITEFYHPNYSIRQRLDMLDVLCVSATALSMAVDAESRATPRSKTTDAVPQTSGEQCAPEAGNLGFLQEAATAPTPMCASWRQIVQQRIAAKSRQFGKSSSSTTMVSRKSQTLGGETNCFADHCESFFFPLVWNINTARNMPELDLPGRDYFVFGRVIYTLATVLHCAQFCVPVVRMASTLLGIVLMVRYHEEPFVRQSALFGLSMIVISLPSSILVTEFTSGLEEIGAWLRDSVIDSDPDDECRRLAVLVNAVLCGKYLAGTRTMVEVIEQ